MRIAVLIPDRNDRKELLENCLRMMQDQSLQPCMIELVNDTPIYDKCDITWRYRLGYERLRNKNIDIIAFIENDDWYHTDYLKTMSEAFCNAGSPDMFGLDHTIYYHIRTFEYFTMHHTRRSSAMNTLIKPDLDIKWGHDNDPYCDVHLWNQIKGVIIPTKKEICLGIKHGIGLCGGQNHTDKMQRFVNLDHQKTYLKSIIDKKSFDFYSNYLPPVANLT